MNQTTQTSTNKLQFDFRMLFVLLLLATVPLLIGTWWLFQSYESSYLDLAGDHLGNSAEMAFQSINIFLQSQIIEIAGLTEVPILIATIEKSNWDLAGDLELIRKRIPEIESKWSRSDARSGLIEGILDNSAAQFLRRYTATNRSYQEIMVTDFLGRLVAASGKTTDYYQADEDWWKATYGDGRNGSVFVGDVTFDASTKTHVIHIAQPFIQPESGIIGIIKVAVDVQALHSVISSTHGGRSANAILLRTNGEVISAPGFSLTSQSVHPATQDILAARENGKRHLLSGEEEVAIYGLPERSLSELYPHLTWVIATTGSVADILGPLPELWRYFLYLGVGILVLTLFTGLLLARMKSRPVITEDPHLERL